MRARVFAALLSLVFCCHVPAPGLAGQTGVYVDPERAFFGAEIRIFGYVQPEPGKTIVEITLSPPGSQKDIILETAAESDGGFELHFNDTFILGTWEVRAARKGTASAAGTSFIITAGVLSEELASGLAEVNAVTQDGLDGFHSVLAGYPDFSGKDEMLELLVEALAGADEMSGALAILGDAARLLEEQLRLHGGGLPHETLQALESAARDADEAIGQIGREMTPIRAALESSRESAEWCHVWLGYHEFCGLLGGLNKAVGAKISSIGTNLGLAQGESKLHPGLKQALRTFLHLLLTKKPSPLGFAKYMTGTLSALGTDIYGKLMTTCSYYKGTIEGDYHMALLHNGTPFFEMSYRLSGEMWLSFEARRPGDPAVHLRGRLSGHAQDFKCDLTMEPFALPGTIAPTFCHCPVPPISPRRFLLYFTGQAMDNTMDIELEKVHSDFDLKAVGFYILLSAHIMGLEFDFLEFPLMNAEWFVTRATKISDPRNASFTLPIKVQGERSVAEETFERVIDLPATSQRKAVRAEMTLKIRVCSPECE